MSRLQLVATARTCTAGALTRDERTTMIVDVDEPERALDHAGAPVDVGAHRVLLALADADARVPILPALLRALRASAERPLHDQLHAALDELDDTSVSFAAILAAGRAAAVISCGSAEAHLIRGGQVRKLVHSPFPTMVAQLELCRGDRLALCSSGLEPLPELASLPIDAACGSLLEPARHDTRHASAVVAEVDGELLLRPQQLVPCGISVQRRPGG